MKPYFELDGVAIYHGDTLNVLNELSTPTVHAVITDPPYASGARTEAAKATSGAMVRGMRWNAKPIENDQMTSTGFVWLMRETCYAVRDLLVDGGSLLIFIDWRQWPNLTGAVETTNFRVNQMIVWDKGSMGMGSGFRNQHELILHASKGTVRVDSHSTSNVLQFSRVANDDHPSPKPEPLMRRLIEVVCARGELVLDPFMGAGTTLVAARQTGRRAIGIEIEEQYCEIAARRLCQEMPFEIPAFPVHVINNDLFAQEVTP